MQLQIDHPKLHDPPSRGRESIRFLQLPCMAQLTSDLENGCQGEKGNLKDKHRTPFC